MNSFIYSTIDWNKIPFLGDESKKVFIIIQSGREREKIDSVQVIRKVDIEVLNEEAVRVIKALPEWSVLYRRGELYYNRWVIPIIFSEEMRKKCVH